MGMGILVLIGIGVVVVAIVGLFGPWGKGFGGSDSQFKKDFDVQFAKYSAQSLEDCNALLSIGEVSKSKVGEYDQYNYLLSSMPASSGGLGDGVMIIQEIGGELYLVQVRFNWEDGGGGNSCAQRSAILSAVEAAMPNWKGENPCYLPADPPFDKWFDCHAWTVRGEQPYTSSSDGRKLNVYYDPQRYIDVTIRKE
ncbi:MAG: hypothetical protein ACREAW_00745 [Nitrososphaera sp.]